MMDETDAAPRILIAGDFNDIVAIRRILSELAADAYGQVFIEILAPVQARRLDAPEGVTISWLVRADDDGFGYAAPRGERISAAVRAWTAEWMPDELVTDERPILLWIGCTASPRVGRLYRELATRIRTADPA
jgi:NADPH-dependent ferric siderophore reductase